jgi:hypothetical protein
MYPAYSKANFPDFSSRNGFAHKAFLNDFLTRQQKKTMSPSPVNLVGAVFVGSRKLNTGKPMLESNFMRQSDYLVTFLYGGTCTASKIA